MLQHLKNAQKVSLEEFAPPTTVSVNIQVTTKPASGRILIYSAPDLTKPQICNGPVWVGSVGYGDGNIYVQIAAGTESYEMSLLGWEEA